MKNCACQKASSNSKEEVTEETLRAVAADRLERLNFQKILAGKNAEISFLEKAMAEQEQIRIKLELLCNEMARKEESFFDGFINALQKVGELEAKTDCLMADKKALQKKIDFLVRAKDQLAQKLSATRKKLNGKEVEEKVDPLHLQLEAEICDRNPPERSLDPGIKEVDENPPPPKTNEAEGYPDDFAKKILAQISGEESG